MNFEQFVDELKVKMKFKNTIDVDDIVIYVLKDAVFFGKVTKIERDFKKKDEWWIISFVVFSIPINNASLIVRTPQMLGEEIFTIGGEERFFAPIDLTEEEPKEKKGMVLKLVKK